MATLTKATVVSEFVKALEDCQDEGYLSLTPDHALEVALYLAETAWQVIAMEGVLQELERLHDMEAHVVGLTGALRRINRYYAKHPEATTAWAQETAGDALTRFEQATTGDWRADLAAANPT